MHWAVLAAFVGATHAYQRPYNPIHDVLRPREPGSTAPGLGKLEYFDQLIDHANPSLGTFKQRYWWNSDHYAGPHSPIVLESPSESAIGVDGDLDGLNNRTLPGLLAQDNQGAQITIEHRYFGPSSPYQNLDTETFQYLTLDNSIQDLIYFAKNVVLPFDKTNGTATKPDQAPWLLAGCSYAGALTAWTEALAPGTFWAYEAGSAVVETQEQFWDYFAPIKNAMPQNCTTDFQRVVKHVDDVLLHGSDGDKKALKQKFGASQASDKDFGSFISNWLTVQQSQQVSDKISTLHYFCDFVENQRPKQLVPLPGPDGVGLDRALDGLAKIYTQNKDELKSLLNFGNDINIDFKSLAFRNTRDAESVDPWFWFLCNEPFEWWQAWSRFDTTGFLSRLWSWKDDIQEICVNSFPDKNGHQYGLKAGRTYHTVNKHTGGWRHVNTTRLVWINGEFDPWRGATVSWEGRPGGALQSTEEVPVYVIKNAGHCNDYFSANGATPEGKAAFDGTLGYFRKWVAEFYKEHPHAAQ